MQAATVPQALLFSRALVPAGAGERAHQVRPRQDTPARCALDDATLARIRSHPNQDVREIASILDVEPARLHPVLNRLRRQGLIRLAGRAGYANAWRAV